MCSLDPVTDTWNWSQVISGGAQSALTTFAVTSDGSTVIAYDGYDIYKLDATTLAVKGLFPVSTGQSLLSYPTMFLGPGDKTVFLSDPTDADVMDVYDFATGKLTGWIPQASVAAILSYSATGPIYQGMDAKGVAGGVITGGGFGLLDTTAVLPLPIGSRFTETQLTTLSGPVAGGGGTATSWEPNYAGSPMGTLSSIYFGSNAATDINFSATTTDSLSAVTPAGSAGPVDIRLYTTDGGSELIPEGFSFGPWVLENPVLYSTEEGGGEGNLYGYGFGVMANANETTYVAPPADLLMTVGARPQP